MTIDQLPDFDDANFEHITRDQFIGHISELGHLLAASPVIPDTHYTSMVRVPFGG